MDTTRWVRIGVLAICVASFVCAAIVWIDLQALTNRRSTGLPIFSNAVVSFPLLRSVEERAGEPRIRPFERIVAVDGEPVATGQEIRARVERAGATIAFTLERLDGSRHIEALPVAMRTQRDVWRIYAPFLLLGMALLIVGSVAVLARPDLAVTRLLFALSAGLGIPMGILLPDHFEGYRFSPWLRGLAFVPVAALLHLGLAFPQRLPPLLRAPRATLGAIYGASALLFAAHVYAFFYDASLLATTAAAMLVALMVGFAVFVINLAASALRAPTARQRQLARVVLPGPIVMLLGLGLFGIGNLLFFRLDELTQQLPVLVLVVSLTYAMLGPNIFEFDAVVRRGTTLVLLVLGGAALYLGLFTLLELWLDTGGVLPSALAMVGVLLLAVPVAGLARERLDRAVERLLFPEQRARRELIRDAAQQVGRLRGSEELLQFLRGALEQALGCTSLRVVSGPPDRPLVEVAPLDREQPLVLAPADPLYVAIRRGVAVSIAPRAPERRGPSRAALHRATQLGAALVVPLPPSEHAIGALLLAERQNGRSYSRDDEALVAMLASQAAAALENAEAVNSLRALLSRLSAENLYLREEARLDPGLGDLVGRSLGMQTVVAQLCQVAPTDASVLVQGETGTGKELVVRAIHARSSRRDRVLVQVACAALPEALLESELFGHEKGAFTGADERKLGRLQIAEGGTLVLDDVDTLPLAVQAKLLRALQEGELQRIGATTPIRVDLRVIAATNRDLVAEVRAGRFREDLYYRLNVVPIRIPPLRERREDIPQLVEHFVRSRSAKLGRTVRGIAAEAMAELQTYAWPGNVRELRNVIERALVMHVGDVLRLPAPLGPGAAPAALADDAADEVGTAPLAELLRRYRCSVVEAALARADGSHQEAARLLGLHRPSLSRMLRNLDVAEETPS